MQDGHVVVLEEGIDPELPVHPLGPDVAAAVAVVREPEGRKLVPELAECLVEIERARRVQQQPDEAVALLGGEAHQGLLADDDIGEVLGPRLRREHAAAVVGPVVVGADDVLAHLTRAVQQAGAAVPARVEQPAHRALVVADQHDRHAGDVEREVVAGPGDLAAEGDRQRVAAEDRPDLVRERRPAGVAPAVHGHGGLGLGQGAPFDTVERFGGEAKFGIVLQRILFAVVTAPILARNSRQGHGEASGPAGQIA